MKLDASDIALLNLLQRDSKKAARELGLSLDMPVTTVYAKIKRMEQNGLIKNYSVMLDHEKLGYELTVVTEITVSKGKLLEMEKEVGKIPNVCAVYDLTGSIDAIAIAKFKNRKELSDFTKRLLAMPFIERTNTHVVLATVKEDHRLI